MTRRKDLSLAAALAAAFCWSVAPARGAGARSGARTFLLTVWKGTPREQVEAAARAMGLTVLRDYPRLGVAVAEAAPGTRVLAEPGERLQAPVLALEEDSYRNWLQDGAAASFQRRVEAAILEMRDLARKPAARRPSRPAKDPRIPWGVAAVDAPAAWPTGRGAGVKVAVVDTGIDCAHPDLLCDFAAGHNVVEPGLPPMDDNMHGTHVAGIIAGRGREGGVFGVAPEATLLPVKVLDASGGGRISDIIEGLDWATSAGADVINMSLGAPIGSPALERAVEAALESGVAVVCAAGNDGPGAGVGFPAAYPGVMAVSAASPDWIAPFSSRGRQVSFIAPGVRIHSTLPGGRYGDLSGTSMASPHVAGLAALAVERGARGPREVARALARAASPVCREKPAHACLGPSDEGAGLPDAAKLR